MYLYLWKLLRLLSENPSFVRCLSESPKLLQRYVTLTTSKPMLEQKAEISDRKEDRMAKSTVDRCLLLDRVATAVVEARKSAAAAAAGGAAAAPPVTWELNDLQMLYKWLRSTHKWPLPSMMKEPIFEGAQPAPVSPFNEHLNKEQDDVCRRYSGKIVSKLLSLGAFLSADYAQKVMTQTPPIELAWFVEANATGEPVLRWLLFHYSAELYEPFIADVYRRAHGDAIQYFHAIADQILPAETLPSPPSNGVTKDSTDFYERAAVWGSDNDLARLTPSKWLSGQPTDVATVLPATAESSGKLAPGVGNNLPALLLLGLRAITSVDPLARIRAFRMVRSTVLHLMVRHGGDGDDAAAMAVADQRKQFAQTMAKMNRRFASKNRGVLKNESNLVAESVASGLAAVGCVDAVLNKMFEPTVHNRPEWHGSETDLMLLAKFCKHITLSGADAADGSPFGPDFLNRLFQVSFEHGKNLGAQSLTANMWISLVSTSSEINVPIIVEYVGG